jgi:hypothetical protein
MLVNCPEGPHGYAPLNHSGGAAGPEETTGAQPLGAAAVRALSKYHPIRINFE